MIGWSVGAANAAEPRTGELGGIGVVLGVEGPNLVVRSILPDSPAAAQKSIHTGDRIVAVAQDQEPAVEVQGGKLARAVGLLRGPKGTTVRVTIVPFGEDDSRARVMSFVRGELKALSAWGDGVPLPKGTKAPDIEMVGLASGKSERLSDYAGKIILLEFWATWCGPCQQAMADLQRYSGEHPDWKDQVVLIAASVDDNQDKPRQHLQAKGWNQTHNVWVRTDAVKAYHVDGIPTIYIIDRQGKIVETGHRAIPEILDREVRRRSYER